MAFHGGALGVILALIVYSWRQKIPFIALSDIVCAVVPIGLFFGRIANFINGELFGRVASKDVSWAIIFPYGGPEVHVIPARFMKRFWKAHSFFLSL